MAIDNPPQQNHSSSSPPETPSSNMHIDLSSLPPLVQPSPPSNTLLITQLTNPSIFHPDTLQQLADLLSQHANGPLHTFSPLKSMRRIIVSFYSTEAAIALRRILDGEEILGCRTRVYFGIETPLSVGDEKERYLAAPDAGRLFFISPPPSPPLGWTMRNEDPPNKAVHADDLASALSKLRGEKGGAAWGNGGPISGLDLGESRFGYGSNGEGDGISAADMMDDEADVDVSSAEAAARRASVAGAGGAGANATLVYHPGDHGCRSDLPAVLVEDVSGEAEAETTEDATKKVVTHTARPPVELMWENEDMDMS